MITWNVWFAPERAVRRWTELLRIVGRERPDVIAFQEVTPPFLALLHNSAWLRRSYTLSDPDGAHIDGYGNLIATRFDPICTPVHPLESRMGRKLVLVEAEVHGQRWTFGCVHLESFRESVRERGRQLEQVFRHLAGAERAALMGDFNFCATWPDEERLIPGEWADPWRAVGVGDGWTVDTEVNRMRARRTAGRKRVRLDRILVRSADARPVRARLLGTRPIRGESPDLWPSDHFGLHVELDARAPAPEPRRAIGAPMRRT